MTDLSRLVESPACNPLPYIDPAFPNRPLALHAARPRDYDVGTPVLFVHHGVGRNGRDYRDYWLNLVDMAGILAIHRVLRGVVPRTSLVPFWQSARQEWHAKPGG